MKPFRSIFLILSLSALAMSLKTDAIAGNATTSSVALHQRMAQRRSLLEEALKEHQSLLDQYEREVRERRQKIAFLRKQMCVLQGAVEAMREAEAMAQGTSGDAITSTSIKQPALQRQD